MVVSEGVGVACVVSPPVGHENIRMYMPTPVSATHPLNGRKLSFKGTASITNTWNRPLSCEGD